MENKYVYCKICDATDGFETVLDLGEIYPSNFVDSHENLKKYPLHLVRCQRCGLVQLEEVVDLDLMYRQYWYKSSLNPSIVKDLANIRDSVLKRVSLEKNDIVMDIGCNDGTLLRLFEEVDNSLYTIGFDPAYNLAEEAQKNCTLFIDEYFSKTHLSWEYERAIKVITSISMFYDLPNPNEFIEDVKYCLHPDGIWVIQFQDLMSMLKSNAFDNICHEHLEYYSLRVIFDLMQRHKLDIFDIEYSRTNGGSLRIYICHQDRYVVNQKVFNMLEAESMYFDLYLDTFQQNVLGAMFELKDFVRDEVAKGKVFYVLGASTKGNTLLQFVGLDHTHIKYALEVNPDKWGKKTVGTMIPIIDDELLEDHMPDYLLVLPWHFNDFFNKHYAWYVEAGGELVYPLPSLSRIRKGSL